MTSPTSPPCWPATDPRADLRPVGPGGFTDQTAGTTYDPADHLGHGTGLFFVGVEGTAGVYAYALAGDGTSVQVAAVATDFHVVADVQFDADLGALWVVCDDACGGLTARYTLEDGAFTAAVTYLPPADADPALANEGFAIADEATCVDGVRATFYADDNDTDEFSLRTGSYPSTAGGTGPGGGPGGGPGTPPGASPAPAAVPGHRRCRTQDGRRPTAGGQGRPALAVTGTDLTGWALGAVGLLVAGTAALAAGRRRATATTTSG